MNVFISQPMNGKTELEIDIERNKAADYIWSIYPDATIMDSFFNKNHPFSQIVPKNAPSLEWLALSLMFLAKSNKAYFVDGWENARGCVIEHMCCEEYGIEIMKD